MTEETIACTLTDGEQISRRERWNRLGERSLDSIVETPNGLLLVFQSSADVEQELRQLAGVDDLALESVLLGATGWIAGVGLAFPTENQRLWDLMMAGEWEKARTDRVTVRESIVPATQAVA